VREGAIHFRFVFDGGSTVERFEIAPEPAEARELRHQKLARVYPALACVHCGSRFPEGGFTRESTSIGCPACGREYDCSQGCFDLLPAEKRASLALRADGDISQNHYDDDALKFIYDGQDGLLLDCGAGLRLTEYTNVVNLEVVPYRSTDVLGDNERLPFADASFDGVLSLAVLEHVKNPFVSAKELIRVLRPGGKLLAVVPLLAPVHAYPHHYYNMTSEGLVNLFRPDIDILETKVPESGLPIWALLWSLKSWSEGLTGAARDSFLKLRVADLLGEAPDYLGRDFVKGLPNSKNFELASTTLLLGKKRV
jgi:SAM-dependent methyltransferase